MTKATGAYAGMVVIDGLNYFPQGMTNWAIRKFKDLQWNYSEFYEYAVEVAQNDDRRLFINIYNGLAEAIFSIAENENVTVHIAMNKEIKERCKDLRDIQKNFFEKFKKGVA